MNLKGFLGILFASTCLVGTAGRIATAGPNMWQAGIAQAHITPDKPLWLAGYGGRTHPAEGALHNLWVKVLALKSADGHRAVLVTSDLLAFPKNISDRICTELERRYNADDPVDEHEYCECKNRILNKRWYDLDDCRGKRECFRWFLFVDSAGNCIHRLSGKGCRYNKRSGKRPE